MDPIPGRPFLSDRPCPPAWPIRDIRVAASRSRPPFYPSSPPAPPPLRVLSHHGGGLSHPRPAASGRAAGAARHPRRTAPGRRPPLRRGDPRTAPPAAARGFAPIVPRITVARAAPAAAAAANTSRLGAVPLVWARTHSSPDGRADCSHRCRLAGGGSTPAREAAPNPQHASQSVGRVCGRAVGASGVAQLPCGMGL